MFLNVFFPLFSFYLSEKLFLKIDPITKAIEIGAIKFRLRFTFSIVHLQTVIPNIFVHIWKK